MALRPSQQFFSHVGTFSWVEPVLCNEDEVSCSRTQQRAPGEIGTCNLKIKSLALILVRINLSAACYQQSYSTQYMTLHQPGLYPKILLKKKFFTSHALNLFLHLLLPFMGSLQTVNTIICCNSHNICILIKLPKHITN